MKKEEPDVMDKLIMSALEDNPRMTVSEIAEKISYPKTTIYDRLRWIRERFSIKGEWKAFSLEERRREINANLLYWKNELKDFEVSIKK